MLDRRGKLCQEGKGKVCQFHNEKGESHKQRDKRRICAIADTLAFVKLCEAEDAGGHKYKVSFYFFSSVELLSLTALVGFIYFCRCLCSDIITNNKISARTLWRCYCIRRLYKTAATVPPSSEVWGSSNKESETKKKKKTQIANVTILHCRWPCGLDGLNSVGHSGGCEQVPPCLPVASE